MTADARKAREVMATARFAAEPEALFEEAAKRLSDGKPIDHDGRSNVGPKLMLAAGVGSQYNLTDAVAHDYATFAVSFARQLICEYDCMTPSEVATAELVAASYAQYLTHATHTRTFRNDAASLRELDRSFRRYLSALGALRSMKRPPLMVNMVKAENAFVGQTKVEITH